MLLEKIIISQGVSDLSLKMYHLSRKSYECPGFGLDWIFLLFQEYRHSEMLLFISEND